MSDDSKIQIANDLVLFVGMGSGIETRRAIELLAGRAPFRRMQVPGGRTMSVAVTNCGRLGWTSDTRGYRYTPVDPLTGRPWPEMPTGWMCLAREAAAKAGFAGFVPDACLVNRYEAGARLGLHQDRDEADHRWPIVSVSIGAEAQFLWGGPKRRDPISTLQLSDGDVLVWGGGSRLNFHGVAPVAGFDARCAGVPLRFNLTFRKAG